MARWAVSQKTPIARKPAASSGPASGNQAVDRPMEMIGPKMKHTSSITDSKEYAVCSCGVPRYRAAQRARIIAPRLGTEPMPAAHTNNTQSGHPKCAASSSPAAATSATSVAGRSTLRCPCWSTSREICGPNAAAASAMVADRAPASP